MEIITLCNQKGGVSKTTSALTLAAGLHKRGYSVLLCDLDAQGNLTFTLGVDVLQIENTLYDVFKRRVDVNDAVVSIEQGFDLLPGSIEFASADREFTGAKSFYMLRDALRQLKAKYDFCIIDTPPTLGVMTENALAACNRLIIPMRADIYAWQGIKQLQAFIEEQQEYTNPDLKIDGLLITCVDERTILAKTMLEQFEKVASDLETKVYKARIRQAVAVGESAFNRSNLYDEAPKAAVTQDYDSFVDEFLKGA